MEKLLTAKEYQGIIEFFETELEAFAKDADELSKIFIPVIGNLQSFPRPSQEARILEEQLGLLKERVMEAVAILNTLVVIAKFKEQTKGKLPLHRLLEEHLRAQVQPFVDYYNDFKNKRPVKKENKYTNSKETKKR